MMTSASAPSVVVVGAGPSGLCAAVRLHQTLPRDAKIVVLEKNDNVSGTWWDNQYPGCGCDVMSHLYSFSFELNPQWSELYSSQGEILRYFDHVARKHNVHGLIRFKSEVTSLVWNGDATAWTVTYMDHTTQKEHTVIANFVVSCVGGLHIPKYPDVKGLDGFKGRYFHTARWDHSVDLTGKRVVVVGNAASATQVVPQIQPKVDQLTILQRSANWVLPRHNYRYSSIAKALFTYIPGLMFLYRILLYWTCELRFYAFKKGTWLNSLGMLMAKVYLWASVKDKALRKTLTPDYPLGCKRIIISDEYMQALSKPNVRVVTAGIDRATDNAVISTMGDVVPADVIIFATGFQVGRLPMKVVGRDGVHLHQYWQQRGGPDAYLGITVPNFPNIFMCLGPSTGNGHTSALVFIESQVNYIVQLISATSNHGLRTIEPRPDVFEAFNSNIQQALSKSIWASNCTSWYKSPDGRIFAAWPHTSLSYLWATYQPRMGDYLQDNSPAKPSSPTFAETAVGQMLQWVLSLVGLVEVYN